MPHIASWTEVSPAAVISSAIRLTPAWRCRGLASSGPISLSKGALDGVLAIAGRYEVPVFVATRGQLARRVIRERRPRAVVAVACERDMLTGLRDVAGKLPVLGLTMQLPNGPCRDAVLDLETMDSWVKGLVGA